mgnify:CR=1 FL=1
MADNNTILEKLEGLVARFEEVSTLITDPGSDCGPEALRQAHQKNIKNWAT